MKKLWVATFVMAAMLNVHADIIPFDGNRVARHKTTILDLTPKQVSEIKGKVTFRRQHDLKLTPEQQAKLQAEAGFAPAEVNVRSLRAVKENCTCEALNLAILFDPDKVEIPHFLLGADLEDRGRNIKRRLQEDQKFYETTIENLKR